MAYNRDSSGRRIDSFRIADAQSMVKAQRGLSQGLPSQPPPRVTTPTITLSSTQPSQTPNLIPAVVSGAPSTKFRNSGGPVEVSGGVFPYTGRTRAKALPYSPGTFGGFIGDVITDDPFFCLPQIRTELGAARLLVDIGDGRGLVEVLSCVTATRAATAQAGAAATITLDASASSVNGFYVGTWLRIASGTGAGQYAQITGYVGSTKVATVDHNWTTVPDATSAFEITGGKVTLTTSTQSGYSTYFHLLDWQGERRFRRYRIEMPGSSFLGFYNSSAISSVQPPPRPTGDVVVGGVDSFGAAAGSDASFQGMLRVMADQLGWNLHNASIGGTGYLNDGNSGGSVKSFTLYDRWFPPVNAWHVRAGINSTGSFPVTQSATTVTVGATDSIATIQAAYDTAFGAGKFQIGGVSGAEFWAFAKDPTLAASTAPMTANFSGVTGGINIIEQYLGDLAPRVPRDGAGNIMPFKIVLVGLRNDTTGSNAAFTQTAAQAAMTLVINAIKANYPQADLIMTGINYLPGGGAAGNAPVVNANAAAIAASASLRLINNKVPFFDLVALAVTTGTGNRGNLIGNGNSDLCCFTDGTHPTTLGHLCLGMWLAALIMELYS